MIVYQVCGVGAVDVSTDDFGLFSPRDLAQCHVLAMVRYDIQAGRIAGPLPRCIDDLFPDGVDDGTYAVEGYTYVIHERTVTTA